MPTYKVFIGGMQQERSYRTIEKARAAAHEISGQQPDAYVVVRERHNYSTGCVGWSNVDGWVNQAIRIT